MYTGPNTVNDGLVFGYDTGYGVADNNTATRFYEGESATNLWDSMLNTQSIRPHTKHYWDGSKWFENSTYTHPGVNGPKGTYLGIVFKHVSGALGSSWSNNSYGYMLRDIACTNGATMTMSSWIYTSNDCSIDSIPAVIEGESGGESTVAGYPASYDLSNKGTWQVTAKKAISDGNTRFIPLYPRKNGVTNGSFTGFFMWALPQVTYGNHVVPPLQPGSTRSSTQSLIDLKRTTNIDVSNLSFDSTGQPTFDGTDDSLTIPGSTYTTSNVKTIEIVFKMNGSYSNFSPLAVYANGSSSTNRIWLGLQDSKFQMHGWGTTDPRGTTTISADEWYVCTFSYNKSTQAMKVYTNGVLESNTTNTQGGVTASSSMNWYLATVPGGWQGVTYSDTSIASFKVYNRILSDDEVAQNFNAYKNRFNI